MQRSSINVVFLDFLDAQKGSIVKNLQLEPRQVSECSTIFIDENLTFFRLLTRVLIISFVESVIIAVLGTLGRCCLCLLSHFCFTLTAVTIFWFLSQFSISRFITSKGLSWVSYMRRKKAFSLIGIVGLVQIILHSSLFKPLCTVGSVVSSLLFVVSELFWSKIGSKMGVTFINYFLFDT